MATLGLRDLYYAPCTESEDGSETFGTPKRLAKAISAKLSVETSDGTLYADDGVDTIVSEFSQGTLTLETNDLADEDVAALLGATIDSSTGVMYSGKDDKSPYFAIGFRAKKPGGKFRYIWLYKVQFKPFGEEFSTKADKIELKTPSIEGTFVALNKNGRWKADITASPDDEVAKNWFSAVVEETIESE